MTKAKRELLSKSLSVISVLLFVIGVLMLFFKWKLGIILILNWLAMVTLSIIIEPKNDIQEISSDVVRNLAKGEHHAIKRNAIIGFIFSLSLLIMFIYFFMI
jgi:Na+/phosphate symporter